MWVNPIAVCSPMDPTLFESPITAIICRAPACSHRVNSSAINSRATAHVGMHVHGIFHTKAIGRPRPKPIGVGVPCHFPVLLGNDVGQVFVEHIGAASRNLFNGRWFKLKAAGSNADPMRVNRLDCGDVSVNGVTKEHDVDVVYESRKRDRILKIVFKPENETPRRCKLELTNATIRCQAHT
jgi:hypothetical protein